MPIKSKFVAQTGVGASAAIDMIDTNDIRVSYAVVVTGTVTYTVQHSVGGEAFMDNTDNTNQTTNQDGNYIFPVQKIRVNVTAGTGTATMYVRQLVI
jgi:hypothetical protein